MLSHLTNPPLNFLVRVARFELATSCSQSRRNEPGYPTLGKKLAIKNNITPYRMERISEWSSILLISHCSRLSQKGKMALSFMSLCVHKRYPIMLFLMVPQARLELAPEDWLLRPACLPIPPPGHDFILMSKFIFVKMFLF